MQLYQTKNYEEMSKKAAGIISAQVILKPDSVLGLATGSTPLGIYENLIDGYKNGDIDFTQVKTVNLDEYKGLGSENKQSYRHFMNSNLFDHVNINKENTNVPNGLEENIEFECDRYDNVLNDLAGVDLQLLGIGNNGHIGFNEPADSFTKGTHYEALAQSTIDANSRLFEECEVMPTSAYTMGIKTIMDAKTVLLVANGKGKAKAIKEALTGPITPKVPASILQMHKNLIVVADEEALSELNNNK
ncbi:MAG: glucosamine-6-phosphate deaminase [Clostridiales bacterium]|nr:glucosamine-6-phosphate deaminase [Clostridiales bacterium]